MRNIILFDDFLPDAADYAKAVKTLPFETFVFPEATFHGISVLPVDGYVPTLIQRWFVDANPTLSFARRSPLGQEEPHYIHTDVDMGQWTALLYLNAKPPLEDGTAFWTHQESGAIESDIPHERSEEGKSTSGWELRRVIRAKLGRMVIFPSSYFHSRMMPDNWGDEKEARLTQVTFGTGDIFK